MHFQRAQCIFTGAGVSFTQDERYRAPGWKQLLRDILAELLEESTPQEADAIVSNLDSPNRDLWDLTTAVKGCAKTEEDFLQAIRTAVLKENESADSYGRLKIGNLRGAKTLNAIVALCSREETEDRRRELERSDSYWRGVGAKEMLGCPSYQADGNRFAFLMTRGIAMSRPIEADRVRYKDTTAFALPAL